MAAVDQVDVDGGPGRDPDRVGEQVQLGWVGVGGQEPGQAAVVGQAAGAGVGGQFGGGGAPGCPRAGPADLDGPDGTGSNGKQN